jgi:hypothetical protein
MAKKKVYLISASTLRSATSLAERRNIPEGEWIYLPWGNSHIRDDILYDFRREGISKDQLLGYFTDGEIFDLTGSF